MEHHHNDSPPVVRREISLPGPADDSPASTSSIGQATAAFRSQRISSPFTPIAPPLQHPGRTALAPPKMPASLSDTNLTMANKKEAVGTIPTYPAFHILERTAIQIPEDTMTSSDLLDRILDYLRVHSISYECERDTGCFDCMSPSMVGFVVQLWKGTKDSQKVFILEVQRRQGCAIAMNAIRRSLIRHVRGGAEPAAAAPLQQQQQAQPIPSGSLSGRRRPFSSEYGQSHNSDSSNKRQRSLSPRPARSNCEDALTISVRLMESSQRDQQRLGLESLTFMTDPRLVSTEDATTVSKALILSEGPLGVRLQQCITSLLRDVQPKSNSTFEDDCCQKGSMPCFLYHLTLHVLANALEQVSKHQGVVFSISSSSFWQTVMACLLSSLQDAVRRPHEAALSAKCIRHLIPRKAAPEQQIPMNMPAMQAALHRSHDYGRAYNLTLEQESQKTLRFL